MKNAKEEFLEHIKNKKHLICAKIGYSTDYGSNMKWFILKNKYSKKDYEKFIDSLDFEYDSGYGSQELFGLILFQDSFSNRWEYDGLEGWENHKKPTIKQIMNFKDDS